MDLTNKKHKLTIQFNNEIQYAAFKDAITNMVNDLEAVGSKSTLKAIKEIKDQVHDTSNYEILKEDYDEWNPLL